ncbi:MAG: NAD-dependent epimerase/dehydratase family protein [Bacteroidales bacterium]|nr:NAD-dependent epimerase/dehydratase family protein [Bacteroidales bacterium]
MGRIDLKGTRILVTGGNGYLGSHLVSELKKEQARVFVMDKAKISAADAFNVDITNRDEVKQAIQKIHPEVVFHLAASLNRERNFDRFDQTNNVNHNGTLNLLLALKGIPYRNFIFTSTSEIYGSNQAPFHEGQIPRPASPYSLTKLYAENLISNFSSIYNKRFTILRLFNFFGRNMPAGFFIPQMMKALKNEAVFEMTEGEQKRDFLYVDDVVRAMILSAGCEAGLNEVFNVCSGNAVSLKQLATEMNRKLHSGCEIKFGALPYRENEVWDMVGDNTKIKNAFGFTVQYKLKEAIDKLIGN